MQLMKAYEAEASHTQVVIDSVMCLLKTSSPLSNNVATSFCNITKISPLGESGTDEVGLVWIEMLQCTECHREHPQSIHSPHNA